MFETRLYLASMVMAFGVSCTPEPRSAGDEQRSSTSEAAQRESGRDWHMPVEEEAVAESSADGTAALTTGHAID